MLFIYIAMLYFTTYFVTVAFHMNEDLTAK